jgi:hypothetical protein
VAGLCLLAGMTIEALLDRLSRGERTIGPAGRSLPFSAEAVSTSLSMDPRPATLRRARTFHQRFLR